MIKKEDKRFKLFICVINRLPESYEIIQTNSAREMFRFLGYISQGEWYKSGNVTLRFVENKTVLYLSADDKGSLKKVRKHLTECYKEVHNRPMRKRDMRSLK